MQTAMQTRTTTLAEQFRKAMDTAKTDRKDASYWKLSKTIYMAVAQAWALDPQDVRRIWFDEIDGDFEGVAKDSIFGVPGTAIRIFPRRLSPTWLQDLFGKEPQRTELWTFFTDCAVQDSSVLVGFMVGATPWVMTHDVAHRATLMPRIMIPLTQERPVYLLPITTYTVEKTR